MAAVWDYLRQPWVLTGFGLSAAIMLLGFLAVPRLLCKLPADYFARLERPEPIRRSPRDSFWWMVRNLLALTLIIGGLVMIVLPGPGLISIVVGAAIGRFPGRNKLLRLMLGNWVVRAAVNAMRAKYGALPLILPSETNSPAVQEPINNQNNPSNAPPPPTILMRSTIKQIG